jgi:hypothetical protein
MEVDSRRLYLGEGCSSLFTYCTRVLHLSEHAAYGRIEAARASRRFPRILELLADGALTLTAVGLLAPHLTADNHLEVLTAARHKTKREIEHLIAVLHPRADVPSSVRELPAPKPRVMPPAPVVRPRQVRATFPQPSSAKSGRAIRAVARSSALAVAATRQASSSSIMSCRTRAAVPPLPTTSSCGALRTTRTRRSCVLARVSRP